MVGTQRALSDTLMVGAMLQFDHVRHKDGLARVSGQGVLVGPYFVKTLKDHPLTIDGRLLWGRSWNEISPFGTYTDQFETNRLLATLEASGQLEYDTYSLMPRVTFSYVEDRQLAYVDTLGITIPEQKVSLASLKLGTDWSMPIKVNQGDLLFTGGLSGIWSSGGGANTGALDGGRGRLDLGLEYFANPRSHLELDVFYDGIGKNNVESFGISMSFEYKF